MTVNIALLTSDAVILGCDSIASTTGYFLDPIALEWDKGPDGKYLQDENKKFILRFNYDDWLPLVTNAWGGVTKLFLIHPKPTPVAAVTTGLAKLNERPIASLAAEFLAMHERRKKKHLVQVEVICNEFLKFMREKYLQNYKDTKLPEEMREGPEFLVGGFGRDDEFPCVYRINVQRNRVKRQWNTKEATTGVAWGGQSSAVERFIRGMDGDLKQRIEGETSDALKRYSSDVKAFMAGKINEILDKVGQPMPEGISLDLPEPPKINPGWEEFRSDIGYSNMPIQEAINFVSFLVGLQSGQSRFTRGVATVGGRTHIAVITKDKGFVLLNEPELQHRNTGFGDDA